MPDPFRFIPAAQATGSRQPCERPVCAGQDAHALEAACEGLPHVQRACRMEQGGRPFLVLLIDPAADAGAVVEAARQLAAAHAPGLDRILVKYHFPFGEGGEVDRAKLQWSVDWHTALQRAGPLISTTRRMPGDGFLKRFMAYLAERYNPVQFIPFYLLLVFAVGALFRSHAGVPFSAGFAWRGLVLAAMLFAFYLLVRIFDEHKDWETDRVAFPERVLSIGLVRLQDLQIVGCCCAAFLLAGGLYLGEAIMGMTLVLLLYALLMRKEFFVGAWLRRHLFLYAVSHNAVVFLSLHLCFLGFGLFAGVPRTYLDLDVHLAALALNGLFFSLEVARKIRLPAFEIEGVDTYSKVIGYRKATWLIGAVHLASLGVLALSGLAIPGRGWVLVGLLCGAMMCALERFLRHPTPAGAEGLLKPVSLAFLGYLAVLILTV